MVLAPYCVVVYFADAQLCVRVSMCLRFFDCELLFASFSFVVVVVFFLIAYLSLYIFVIIDFLRA